MRIIFADFALHGQAAVVNAEAAHCARDQGKFWAYHDLLYQNIGSNEARYTRNQLDGFARKLGLNMPAFGACLETHKYRELIIGLYEEGRNQGLAVVPTILVNQQIIEGYVPFSDLQAMIEVALSRRQGE